MLELEYFAQYWPNSEAIRACIGHEAEAIDESVFLAVHQPSVLIRRNYQNQSDLVQTEKNMLEAFLVDAPMSGTLVMPITGASGAGKSHLIRWLYAEIHGDPHRHVIRISKSSGLRKVLEEILKGLVGPEYDEARKTIDHLQDSMDLDDCVERLATELAIALDHAKNPDKHSQGLRHVLRDPEVRPHLLPALKRIAKIALGSAAPGSYEEGENEDSLPLFQMIDLDNLDEVNWSDARRESKLYRNNLSSTSAKNDALKKLNDVIDTAVRAVFGLHSVNRLSMSDALQNIRRQLFLEGRELVLLVEDFAALAGVQHEILMVCIQEAERNGVQDICTMRTALAVTDGYLNRWDTIMTRAQHEWRVVSGSGEETEDESLDRVCDFVGAYLNAARHGRQGLAQLRREGDWDGSPGRVPVWSVGVDDARHTAVIDAFGTCDSGVPLFPFNREAVRYLLRKSFGANAATKITPRSVINNVIRYVLLSRGKYLQGKFLSEYSGLFPGMFIEGQLKSALLSQEERAEVGAAIKIWGGDPTTPELFARFNPAILLGLGCSARIDTRPTGGSNTPPIKPTQAPAGATGPGGATTPPSPRPAPNPIITPEFVRTQRELKNLSNELEQWANGQPLVQGTAGKLRDILVKGMDAAIDWNMTGGKYETMKPSIKHLSLPNSGGGGSDPIGKISVCGATPANIKGSVNLIYAACIVQEFAYWKSMGDDERMASLANAGALVGSLTGKFARLVETAVEKTIRSMVTNLASCHMVLGSYVRTQTPHEQALVLLSPGVIAHPSPGKWESSFRRYVDLGEALRGALDRFLYTYKGGDKGNNPKAVMAWRVRPGVGLDSWPEGSGKLDPDAMKWSLLKPASGQRCQELLPSRRIAQHLTDIHAEWGNWGRTIRSAFDGPLTPRKLITEVQKLLADMRRDAVVFIETYRRETEELDEALIGVQAIPEDVISRAMGFVWDRPEKPDVLLDLAAFMKCDAGEAESLAGFADSANNWFDKIDTALDNGLKNQREQSVDKTRVMVRARVAEATKATQRILGVQS